MTDSSRINEEVGLMAKKIVVVNAGPRAGFNTDTLLKEAAKGWPYTELLNGYKVKKLMIWEKLF